MERMQEVLSKVRSAYPLDSDGRYAHVNPALLGLLLAAGMDGLDRPTALAVPSEEEGRGVVQSLQAFGAFGHARLYPTYPVTPYDFMPVPVSIKCQVMECLHAWATGAVRLLILPAPLLAFPFPEARPMVIKPGMPADRDSFLKDLGELGYQKTSVVAEKESLFFCSRGKS